MSKKVYDFVIYKTTNLINNKIYVGKDYFNSPSYFGSGVMITRAIKKYGNNNFKKDILEKCSNKEETTQREIFWINELKSYDKTIGYNILRGIFGDWLSNHPDKEAYIAKQKKNKTWNYRDQRGNKNSMWGKKHSPRTIKLLKEKAKNRGVGKDNPRAKPLYQYSIDGKFIKKWEYAKACTDFYSLQGITISRGNISNASSYNTAHTNNFKIVKGFIFSFNSIQITDTAV